METKMGILQNYFSIKALLWVLVVFVQIREHKGCLEEERIGLLKLKSFFMSNPYTSSDHLLPSWLEDDSKSECCGWERVACNSTTRRVTELSLDNLKLSLGNPYYYTPNTVAEIWSLNVSLLEPFKELRSLDLSLNAIKGWIVDEGFEKLSILSNLEILNLGYNFFNDNSILQSLGAITSLKTLNLTWNGLRGYFPAQALVGLRTLNTLDISNNGFNGTLPNQGFERLTVLKKLETLILDENEFDDSILPSLSRLTSLTTLSLAHNPFLGSRGNGEGWESLSRFENLEILDLSFNFLNKSSILQSLAAIKSLKNLNLAGNEFAGSLPINDLANFSKLEILDISENLFTGSVSPSIWQLFSLKALSLSSNELNGTLPIREFCKLKKLEELDLSHNGFEGILPPCINNMTSLRFLDVSENLFKGDISSYIAGASGQMSLNYFDFSYNQFEGLFSLSFLANHSKLEVIRFFNENNKLEIETENPLGWVPLFQLKVLQMSNCSLNKPTSNIPTFLLNQDELEVIDLSYNKLKGRFPNWLVENNTRLKGLVLRDNLFMGRLHFQLQQHTYISRMDISNNHMDGKLQENIGKMCPNLNYLNLSHNCFEGNLPSSIGEMTILEALDLSFNKFSGEIPRQLARNASQVMDLNLGYNSFHGEILLEQFKSTSTLQMSGNQFTTIVPVLNSTYSYLNYLDISSNNISGAILIGLKDIKTLLMANNGFYGQIPCELLSDAIVTIDLSHNFLTGSLPVCLNMPSLEHLYLQGNKFTGSIPKALFNSSSLLIMDMRDNNFSGSISAEIKQLPNLKVLLLSGNCFTGIIPNQLCLLKMISIMDLSKNAFSGPIPQCLHNIYFGKIGATNPHYFIRFGGFVNLHRVPYMYKGFLEKTVKIYRTFRYQDAEVQIEFVTKYRSLSYKGSVLVHMSGLDLSCNNLTGAIPLELGQISSIIALNLSYNQLDGTIPKTFSNLALLESLDLSHNSLSGEIPSSLIDLNFLAVFSVAHNNLSGKLPDMKAQFGTFEKSSYEGNLFLCGPPLDKSCSNETESDPTPTQSSNASDGKWYEVDPVVFRTSFLVSYLIFFFTVMCLLYINPYWLQRCYSFMEDHMYSCYYFVFDTSKKLSNCVCN